MANHTVLIVGKAGSTARPMGIVGGVAAAKSLDAVTANANGSAIDLEVAARTHGMQVVLTGGPTGGTVTLQGTLDGTNWFALATFTIGTDASGDIKFAVDTPVQQVRAVLAGLAGGISPTVTAWIGSVY